MNNKEKVEFFKEWIEEIDRDIERVGCELASISLPNNRELWKLEQKCKIYSSTKDMREFFSGIVNIMDIEMEGVLGEIYNLGYNLNMYNTLKAKVEEEMSRYQEDI